MHINNSRANWKVVSVICSDKMLQGFRGGGKIASSIRNAKCDMNQKLQAQDEFKIKEGEDGPLVTTAQARM